MSITRANELMEWWAKMGKRFTLAEDEFLRRHINQCYTLHSLVDMFNTEFPEHQIKYSNLGKRLEKLGIKKRSAQCPQGCDAE